MTDTTTTGAAPAEAATTIALIIAAMPTTSSPIKSCFYVLLNEIEGVEWHFNTAKATAKTHASAIKTGAGDLKACRREDGLTMTDNRKQTMLRSSLPLRPSRSSRS